MADSQKPNTNGVGFFGWLGLLFIGLKLTGYISWPWVWVLAPIWIPLALGVTIVVTFTALYIIFKDK